MSINRDPVFLADARKNKLKLNGTDPRTPATNSPWSNVCAEKWVQTINNAISRMSVDQEAEWDELLSIVVNAIFAKESKTGYNLYEMMFAASP